MELTPFKNLPKSQNSQAIDIINNADLSLKYKPKQIEDFIGNK